MSAAERTVTAAFPDANGVISTLAIVPRLYRVKQFSIKRGTRQRGSGNPLIGTDLASTRRVIFRAELTVPPRPRPADERESEKHGHPGSRPGTSWRAARLPARLRKAASGAHDLALRARRCGAARRRRRRGDAAELLRRARQEAEAAGEALGDEAGRAEALGPAGGGDVFALA